MKGTILSCLIALYCALLPLEEALAFSFGSILKPLGIIIIVLSIIFYGININHIIRVYWPLLLWLLYMFISSTWVASIEYWTAFFTIYVGQIAFLIALETADVREIRMNLIRWGLILAGLVASFILVYFPVASMITDEGRRSVVLFGNPIDPNIIATEIAISIHLCVDYILRERRWFPIVLLGSLSLFLFYGLLLTGSRGGLLSLLFGLFVMFWLLSRQKKSRTKVFQIALIAGLALLIIIPMLPESLLESRFTQATIFGRNELEDGSHNRYTIWGHSLTLISRNPIFGYGCGNFMSAIGTVYRICASHNLFILLIVEGGVIGASFFLLFLYKIVKDLYKRRALYAEFALMTSVLIMALTLDSITYKYFWVAILYSRLCIKRFDSSLADNS